MHTSRLLFILTVVVCLCGVDVRPLLAQSALPDGFDDVHVASVPFPTAMTATPDGRLLIGSQSGQIFALVDGALTGPVLDLGARNCAYRERGLTGVAVDPGFASNRFIYVAYTFNRFGNCDAEIDETPAGRVSRFLMAADGQVDAGSEHVLIDNIPSPIGVHNLGDLKFGPDGLLYIGVGDGGCDYAGDSGCFDSNDAAGSLSGLVGKILRIAPDGSIPPGNPYVGPGSVRCNVEGAAPPGSVCQEIFASGLRNPWRMAFDPNAGGVRFFINDVGQDTWEEINEAAAGADYGWNAREGFCANSSTTDCSPTPPPGLTNPIFAYGREEGCASVTGGAFVPDGIWPSEYTGTYLFSDFVCGSIFILRRQQDGSYTRETLVAGAGDSTATDLFFGPHGQGVALYYTTYNGGGELRRLSFVGGINRAPVASLTANVTFGPPPLTVDLSAAASSDRDGDPLTYEWNFGDGNPPVPGAATARHTYATAGTYHATVTVSDPEGLSSTAILRIDVGNAPPQVTILSPAADYHFVVGEEIVLRGAATDAEDGALPDSALSWRVILHHNTHTHGFLPSTSGNAITFKAPGPENALAAATSHLAVELTATDSRGRTTTAYQLLMPRTVDVTFVADPAGPRLKVDLDEVVTPVTFRSWVNYGITVEAPSQVGADGTPLVFLAWADGGPATRTIVTPATDATYRATFAAAVPSVPGRIEAEAFANGGPGVSYLDTTPNNEGGAYRQTGVDIEATTDGGGGYNVGWIEPGEWLQYDVSVTEAGDYAVRIRVASEGAGGTFHIEVGGADRTGPIVIPATGGWQTWTTVTATIGQLTAGPQSWRLVIDGAGPGGNVGNINYLDVVSGGSTGGGAPYGGTPAAFPGRLEVENYDTGAAGTSFSDTTTGNLGGAYRSGDVDVEPTVDEGGGHGIGWAVAGEWTAYTVNVASAGIYDISVRVASAGAGGRFHIDADGTNISGPLTIPDTGGWQIWQTVRASRVSLTAGTQTWRLVMDADGSTGAVGNVNWVDVAPSDPGQATAPFSGTPLVLPGVIEAEGFDLGPQGSAYADTTPGNAGGGFRPGDVDLEPLAGAAGGYNVGWATAGEWLQYSVQVQTAGTYEIAFRVASEGLGGFFHLEVNGTDVTGPVAVPDTGGWQTWTTVRVPGITLAAGAQTWRLVLDTNASHGGVGNFDAIAVSTAGVSGPTAPEIVLYAADVPAQNVHGNWALVSDLSAAGGAALASADRGEPTVAAPGDQPTSYVDLPFAAEAGVRYRLWIRMKAADASKFNDSIWVQFSSSIDGAGVPRYRIGSEGGLNVNQATCSDCVPSGWGWQNRAYWEGDTGEVLFASSGPQTLRIQIREDGVSIDQIVLSPSRFLANPPGSAVGDGTIISR